MRERRILILAAAHNDARLSAEFLASAGMSSQICRSLSELSKRVGQGCAAVLLAEETLQGESLSFLVQSLSRQPPWSDLPVTIITSGGEVSQMRLRRLAIFGPGGNVSLLERPFRPATLVSCMKVALRARERQYEIRDSLLALKQSELRYSQLIHSLPTAVCTTDVNGRLTLFNEAAVKLWGRTPVMGVDSWCGSHRIFRPDGTPLPPEECPMAVTLKEGRPVQGEEIIIERPDGGRRHVLPYPELILDASGKVVGAINMLLDITDTKRGHEALERLAAIVESSDDAIISKDLRGSITSWNRGAECLFGYKSDEIIGQSVTILIPKDRWDEEPSILARVGRGEHIDHYETVRQRKDGSLVEVSLSVSPLKDVKGKIIGASKFLRDISQQRRAKRELEQAHEEVLAASRAKDDFLAALSHELRMPLNPVLLLASDAAQNPELPPEIRAQFEMIRNNVDLEARLIDDLLDITRIRHNKLSLDLAVLDVTSVLRAALTTIRHEIDRKEIELEMQLAPGELLVNGDAVRLQQVFWNVLKNAVKFTSRGGRITVAAASDSDHGGISVRISDTGIGMTPEEIGRIFEAFSQGRNAANGALHRFGGLGLGLAIARRLVELHSGRISASSLGRNQGSSFIIELPLTILPKTRDLVELDGEKPRQTRAAFRSSLRILLVDDHDETRLALTQLLRRRRHDVTDVRCMTEAREACRCGAFDILISDIGLPDGSGFELMSELRRNHGLRGIAMTGYGTENDIARSVTAGFVAHLTKPVRIQELENALAIAAEEPTPV
jgi:PAS domain S-box-containing protein